MTSEPAITTATRIGRAIRPLTEVLAMKTAATMEAARTTTPSQPLMAQALRSRITTRTPE
jgi:hypothetical protein